jgi:hypothetical protein
MFSIILSFPGPDSSSVERFGRLGVGFGGVDPRVLFIPDRPNLTGLTGAAHRSDLCKALWVLPRVNVLVSSLLSHVAAVLSSGRFGAWKVGLGFWGFPA